MSDEAIANLFKEEEAQAAVELADKKLKRLDPNAARRRKLRAGKIRLLDSLVDQSMKNKLIEVAKRSGQTQKEWCIAHIEKDWQAIQDYDNRPYPEEPT